jgi:tetratricopeptide (TPR) repeat protein
VPRRRTIAIVAGSLVAGVIVIAVIASHGGTPASTGDAGAGRGPASGAGSQPDPSHEIVARANELVAQGEREAALDLLTRSRRQAPDSADLAYAAGRIYFSKFYWTDGLKSFRDAIRNDPTYRTDPELIKTVLRGFITTPGYNDELASFLREAIGSAAQPFLEETARDHPNAAIRTRAATELRRYP